MPTSILPQNQDEKELFNAISSFFCRFKIGDLLRTCNAQKEKGVPTIRIFKYKLCNVFTDRSMYMQQKTGSFRESFSKNTFYRFLNGVKTNWLRFTTLLSKAVADTIEPLTGSDRVNAFVIDDSLFERTSCKKTELGSKVFDHASMRYTKGFRLLTLGWTDGNTFLPVNSCLLASSKASNIIGSQQHFDGRSLAAKRRKLAQMKGTSAMLELLKTALSAGHTADYVLMDSWFSNPAHLVAIKNLGLDSIAMIKKSSRIRYEYDGEQLPINKIFGICKKRRGRSKYLLSVNVMVGKDQKIPAKIVCVRNNRNKKDWIAFICTNPDLSEEEIIRIYGKRWQIESKYYELKEHWELEQFNGATSRSIEQEFFITLTKSNFCSIIKNEADRRIDLQSTGKETKKYQSTRSHLIGRLAVLFPMYLTGQAVNTTLEDLVMEGMQNKSLIQPGKHKKKKNA